MSETENNSIARFIQQARERLGQELRAHAEQLQQLEASVQALRDRERQLERLVEQQLEALAAVKIEAPPAPDTGRVQMEGLLAAVRELITATLPDQVLEVLTAEGQKLGVRTAVFDVRGKAAWGSSAAGFAGLADKAFRSLIVPLTQDNPFRTCYETGGHVDASVDSLKKNRNIMDKLRPDPSDPILLLPVRSAGAVSAIFYADAGGTHQALPAEALKILAEFAGAQLDRLMAFSGGMPAPAEAAEAEVVAPESPAVEAEPSASVEEMPVAEPLVEAVEPAPAFAEATPPAEPLPAVEATVPAAAEAPSPIVEAPPPLPPPAAGVDLTQLTEADQKLHRDAKRFAKLLVSEIELYNKAKVAEGRRNTDLYKRLKTDIDRSRQTYEKRFGKTLGKQHDYFHEELVRTLAGNESVLLGPEYPGPTV
ncbi:MAG: hypothetical protein LAN62_16785 [Acidobacteriia bacterium]|nr:hypothetical protein [Terriglobia bacterium]